jgi:hypothetical protein
MNKIFKNCTTQDNNNLSREKKKGSLKRLHAQVLFDILRNEKLFFWNRQEIVIIVGVERKQRISIVVTERCLVIYCRSDKI